MVRKMLRIFLSSVQREFQTERKALKETIIRLQQQFVGMEIFGAQPLAPRDYDWHEVTQADLFVLLLGDTYGSVEPTSGKSYTELEYMAAQEAQVPVLGYVRGDCDVGTTIASSEARQADFKRWVVASHILQPFTTSEELLTLFLTDFLKQVTGPLFGKCMPASKSPISADILRTVCQDLLDDQLRTVGRQKYLSELYTERQFDVRIHDFVHYEERFLASAEQQLSHLEGIQGLFRLAAGDRIAAFRAAMDSVEDTERLRRCLGDLRQAFFVRESRELLRAVRNAVLQVAENGDPQHDISAAVRPVAEAARRLPFLDAGAVHRIVSSIGELATRQRVRGEFVDTKLYADIVHSTPSYSATKVECILAEDVLGALEREIERCAARCLAVVGPAGHGKTSALCHAASSLSAEAPVVLLSGQMELVNQHAIELYIKERLEGHLRGFFSDWLVRIDADLRRQRQWLIILLDGINENPNLPRLLRMLSSFLGRIENHRIKLVVSCRDIYWELFGPRLGPHLFGGTTVPTAPFTAQERDAAQDRYFRYFDLRCELDEEGRRRLCNPLLMRFFCEAHRGRDLDLVGAPELLGVFEAYLDNAARRVAENLGWLDGTPVLDFVTGVARAMWEERRESIPAARLGLRAEDFAKPTSIYSHVRSEHIIFEEISAGRGSGRSVRFIYDRFMEYLLARSWRTDLEESGDPVASLDALLPVVAAAIPELPAALGAVVFLDRSLGMQGTLLSQLIPLLFEAHESFPRDRQAAVLYAFQNINWEAVDEALAQCLDRFERTASDGIKEDLAPLVLRLLRQFPNQTTLQRIAKRLLEIEETEAENSEALAVQAAKKASEEPDIPLPPARHHYSEQNRLTAIAILADGGSDDAEGLVERGTRRLGGLALHSALKAVAALDRASDRFVYRMIEQYLEAPAVEFRIYCTWLLRRRYGREPAALLVRLLSDRSSRVHQFAFEMLQERGIEPELVEELVGFLRKKPEPKPWHLLDSLKLLGTRRLFREVLLEDEGFAAMIVEELARWVGHTFLSVRVEACRALLAYRGLTDVSGPLNALRRDREPEILRLLAQA